MDIRVLGVWHVIFISSMATYFMKMVNFETNVFIQILNLDLLVFSKITAEKRLSRKLQSHKNSAKRRMLDSHNKVSADASVSSILLLLSYNDYCKELIDVLDI